MPVVEVFVEGGRGRESFLFFLGVVDAAAADPDGEAEEGKRLVDPEKKDKTPSLEGESKRAVEFFPASPEPG